MTRAEKIAEANRLRDEEGLSYRAIGEILGHPHMTIYGWLNPEWKKEHNRKQNAKRGAVKRTWEAGECPRCGGRMATSRRRSTRFCGECSREQQRREARERTERFIAMREEGLLNTEIAEREGVPRQAVATAISRAHRYGLKVPRSPCWKRDAS